MLNKQLKETKAWQGILINGQTRRNQVKIKKQEEGLWSLEDDYRTAKKKIEESYESLDHNRSQLTRLYEEFENVAYDLLDRNLETMGSITNF